MRRPDGYRGVDHETIGSDVLSVMQALRQISGDGRRVSLPDHVLGADMVKRLATVEAGGWYPIGWLLEMMERIDQKLGRYALIKLGRTLFQASHRERVLKVATCARDVVYGIDAMYHHANRGGDIGGWEVVRFDAGVAELLKTTPHHCAMEEGILAEALAAVGARSVVEQRQCFREGAGACRYVITSAASGARWGG